MFYADDSKRYYAMYRQSIDTKHRDELNACCVCCSWDSSHPAAGLAACPLCRV